MAGVIFIGIMFAVIGACLGSFSSVLITRLKNDEDGIWTGRSKCANTGKTLQWYELIPIVSWLAQCGKSNKNGKPISSFYIILEVVYAFVFAVFAVKFLPKLDPKDLLNFAPIFIAVFFALVLFFYDAKYMLVDRRISFPAILLAFIWALFQEPYDHYLFGGMIGFAFYFLQYIISKGKWVGAGDQELGLFMGLVLGWKMVLFGLFLAYIIGMIYVCGLLIFGKKITRKTALPMGAFLIPAMLIMMYDGAAIEQLYWSTFSVSFGLY